MSFYQSKGCCEEVTFIEVIVVVLLFLGIFGLLGGEGGSVLLIVIAAVLLFLAVSDLHKSLERKGFNRVEVMNPVEHLAITRTTWAHIPGTSDSCRVRLVKNKNRWTLAEPKDSVVVKSAASLHDRPSVQRWCGLQTR